MSTRDMFAEITEAYKKRNGSYYGHYFPIMAELTGQYRQQVFGSIAPQCGQLLFVNEKKQRVVTGNLITFTYTARYPSGYTWVNAVNGSRYQRQDYAAYTGIYTGQVYIPRGQRENGQVIYDTHYVDEITSITQTDSLQDTTVYCLADDGMRLLYAQNTEYLRDLEDVLSQSYFIAPPECILCEGSGTYSGITCPDCSGYKYVGITQASGSTYNLADFSYSALLKHGKSMGTLRETESQHSFQWRTWAKRWNVVPTQTEITRYVSNFLRIPEDIITIEKYYLPECYFKISVPLNLTGSSAAGLLLSPTGNAYNELIMNVVPAGSNGILEGYYLVGFYESGLGTSISATGYAPCFSDAEHGFDFSNFGSDWGTDFFYNSGYFVENSGISGNIWSGNSLNTDEDFYLHITSGMFENMMLRDSFTGYEVI